ncbi:hypothetical protein E3G52_000305 [Mycobacteroides abscessus]|uniref:hypothetical protein n=1 Tax=Mycobacteroides abscessus TaxID=36809 RepID=UPI0018785C6B|nr:hypothetical protein [Mycobacteroides abscessus]MBE5453441.1 hypothetical protein [Mycobacteroides abscessus]
MAPRIEPQPVIDLVEHYISDECRQSEQYDNREPLDESGCWSLHELAAQIYAKGYDDGERAEGERQRRQSFREREANQKASQ